MTAFYKSNLPMEIDDDVREEILHLNQEEART